MKTVNVAQTDNQATFFVDVCGDIHDTAEGAEILGIDGTVTIDNGYPGSIEAMRAVALEHYNETV